MRTVCRLKGAEIPSLRVKGLLLRFFKFYPFGRIGRLVYLVCVPLVFNNIGLCTAPYYFFCSVENHVLSSVTLAVVQYLLFSVTISIDFFVAERVIDVISGAVVRNNLQVCGVGTELYGFV